MFNNRKSTQTINYFVRKFPDLRLNKMKALKLLWAADRYHLRKYGRPIVGDNYVAMKNGPVQSVTKDILERDSYLQDQVEYGDKFLKIVGYELESIAGVDENVFSDTDLEALEFAFVNFGDLDKWELCELTHKYPEWKKFKEELLSKRILVEVMDYTDFFKNSIIPDDNFTLDKDILEQSKEVYEENIKTELIWNNKVPSV